ncbi:phosphatidylinositol glycan Mannosyltransferase (PIG-M) family protein [Babesia bovis T2Bo]|uniref:phosphatidylinositol glycan Mannosyltransferase (PIG-M) family protein n=1 Tax=Babesia bovis T2Bo TaxID=484906 RepID=UPI001C3498EA|nr:phosphatidylinositol glycan Mannosyltransferase (PIG-M) family protein [Babesia bovis T2Bo]EDO06015.2 phosphatidylinositol glycan Mannosyltransferase (PIG-M) family protein [Babesia bovis T2Bo]
MLDNFLRSVPLADRDPVGYMIQTYFPPRVLLYIASTFIHVFLAIYSSVHDTVFEVKYTDVDYNVFTDAARLLLKGESVYDRHTYRYTPLLALLVTPNVFLHRSFGKLLFSVFDLLAGYMLEGLLEYKSNYLLSLWLLNPFVIIISTRGNADCIICFLVIATLYFVRRGQIVYGAIFYGLAVHFKIYPVIYALPFVLYFSLGDMNISKGKCSLLTKIWNVISSFVNHNLFVFGTVSISVLLLCTIVSYYCFGDDFLYESLLYHYVRKDHRHNFSIFFNLMYHLVDSDKKINNILTFIPQFVCLFSYGLLGHRDLELSMFLQTVSFVALNKVITCQYHLWWMCLLPLVLSKHVFSRGALLVQRVAIFAFVVANAAWLFYAYGLEMKGYNTYNMLLFCSVAFVVSQMSMGWLFLRQRVSKLSVEGESQQH